MSPNGERARHGCGPEISGGSWRVRATRCPSASFNCSLRLGRQLGTEVVPVLSRKEQADPTLRSQALAALLCQTGQLSGAIRIPDTVGQLVVTADLRSSKVTCHIDVDAPREGRPTRAVPVPRTSSALSARTPPCSLWMLARRSSASVSL